MTRKHLSLPLVIVAVLCGFLSQAGAADRGPINSGETKTALNITGPSFLDTWTFQGNTGDRAVVNAVKTSGSLDTRMVVYPPGGGPAEAWSTWYCSLSACGWTDQLDWQLQHTGVYTIVVEDGALANSGTYNVSFVKMPGAVNSAADPDGGAIASGETVSGTVNAASDMDAFQFYGNAGDRAVVSAVTTSGSLDTRMVVYPPGGGPAEAWSTWYCSLSACDWTDQLDWQLQHTGLYTIVVEDGALANSGTYNMSFVKMPGAVNSPADPDGGAIASGETKSGTVSAASDMDAFFFYGNAGDRAIVSAVTTSGSLDTRMVVYPPGGGPAEKWSTWYCSLTACGWTNQLDWQLQRTGLYTILVEDGWLANSGTYDISLTKVPSDVRPGLYNPSPAVGAVLCDPLDALGWSAAVGATGYDVYFGDDVLAPLVKIGDNLPSTTLPFPAVESGKIYYWRVIAHTPGGDIAGPVWWFEMRGFLSSIRVNGGAAVTSSTSVTLTLSCTPESGACAAMRFSNDNVAWSAWSPYATSKSWALTPGNGTKTVYARYRDSAGSESCTCQDSIELRAPNPDLIVSGLVGPSKVAPGSTVSVKDTTKNNSAGPAAASTTSFYFSRNATLEPADPLLGSRAVPALGAYASSPATTSVTIPAGTAPGKYYLIARADSGNAVLESRETNNARSLLVYVGPDLVVSALTAPISARTGATISVTDTTKNTGGAAGRFTVSYYLSINGTLDGTDRLLGSRIVDGLATTASSRGTVLVTIPSGTVPARYYVIAKADSANALVEMVETNNTRSKVITITP